MNKKMIITIAAVAVIAVGAVYAYRMNTSEACPPGMTGGDCCKSTEVKAQDVKSSEQQTTASTEAHSCCPSGTEKKQ